jgi:hypothetical protein
VILLNLLLVAVENIIARIPPRKWIVAASLISDWVERLATRHGHDHPVVKVLKHK